MPATAVETIRATALGETLSLAEGVQLLPWTDGLSQLEQFITSPDQLYTKNHVPVPRQATELLDAIAGDSGFMIALVFDQARTKAVALPLPEVFEGSARTELGLHGFTRHADLTDIDRYVRLALIMQAQDPAPWKQRGVVLIEKNLGAQRKRYPITVATLDIQKSYPQKDQYMDWIQRIQDELNGVPSSGK